jgi:mono/diheme cytochrome c family protein
MAVPIGPAREPTLPTARWPEFNVDPALRATDPSRAGLALFVKQCLPCHAVNGAGASALVPI